MNVAEKVISSLRRSGALILKNVWLLGWAGLYTISLPALMLGGTGVPILIWIMLGRPFDPGLLRTDPAAFLLDHLPMVLFSMIGCLVAFTVYLVILLFYNGAVTGVAVRAIPAGGEKAEKIAAASFWEEGKALFGISLSTATLASLVPLLPLLALMVVLLVAAFKIPSILTGNFEAVSGYILLAVAFVLSAVATGITTFVAFLWYRLALCASRLEDLPGPAAMGRAWRFVTSHTGLVIAYVLAIFLLGVLSWGITAPLSFGGKLMGHLIKPLGVAMEIVAVPLSIVLSIFMDLWLKCALVALYTDNR